MKPSYRSVSELPDFPYASFEEFVDAVHAGLVRVRVRYQLPTVWAYSTPAERCGQVFLTGSAAIASLAFVAMAAATHDRWYLCGAVAAFVGLLAATPTPGLISGGGCIAVLLFATGFVAGVFVDRSLVWAGIAGSVCWFLACAGQGVGDVTIRDAMVRSEPALLQLLGSGAIVNVEAVTPEPAGEAVAGPSVGARQPGLPLE